MKFIEEKKYKCNDQAMLMMMLMMIVHNDDGEINVSE